MSEINFLSRKDFFAADTFKSDIVELPELGEGAKVRVRELTAFEAEEIGYGSIDQDGNTDARATRGFRQKLVLWATIDEEGKPVFNKGDAQRLPKLPNAIVMRLATRILILSGLAEEETEEGTEEEAEEQIPNG